MVNIILLLDTRRSGKKDVYFGYGGVVTENEPLPLK